jgi:two-component system chemotaxis response regulator CheY
MGKVLVVDDQESMRQIISGMLTGQGHSVKTTEDGVSALDQMKTDHFDLIVADVNMPRMDGLEFLKKVKSEDPKSHVIFVTGMLEDAVRLGSENLGLDGLILKPFDEAAALEVINKVLA